MKTPKPIYVRVLIGFSTAMILAMALLAALFWFIVLGKLTDDWQRIMNSCAHVFQDAADLVGSDGDMDRAVHDLSPFLSSYAELMDGFVWIEDSAGTILAAAPNDDLPDVTGLSVKRFGLIHLSVGTVEPYGEYFFFPLKLAGQRCVVRGVFFKRPPYGEIAHFFLACIVIIGILAALLAIPAAKSITSPLKELEHGALRVAEGHLDQKVRVCCNDEIGRVGKAFNTMADNLKRMADAHRSLLANISHELRSPLTRMRMAEELARMRMENGQGEAAAKQLGDIRNEIELLDGLIGRLLELTKAETLYQDERPLEIDFTALVAETAERYRTVLAEKGVGFTLDLPEPLPYSCRPLEMRDTISGLLDNAAKYVAPKGEVRVSLARKDAVLELEIGNTHTPLSDKELKDIFDPFKRLAPEDVPGNGLGLALARKAVLRHRGVISAGNGARGFFIRILLPLNDNLPGELADTES